MSIEWIDVEKRVPDDRRQVLVWGRNALFPGLRGSGFMGSTRYNQSQRGGCFDCERSCRFGIPVVTHWAEINGPEVEWPRK